MWVIEGEKIYRLPKVFKPLVELICKNVPSCKKTVIYLVFAYGFGWCVSFISPTPVEEGERIEIYDLKIFKAGIKGTNV